MKTKFGSFARGVAYSFKHATKPVEISRDSIRFNAFGKSIRFLKLGRTAGAYGSFWLKYTRGFYVTLCVYVFAITIDF